VLFRVAETLLVGFDHWREVAGGAAAPHWLLLGWVMSPTDEAFPTLALQADGVDCRTLHLTAFPRPDIAVPEGQPAWVLGFVLLAVAPPASRPDTRRFGLALAARGVEARIALPAAGLGPGLSEVLADGDWSVAHALLAACTDAPDAHCLLEAGGGVLGAFSDWLDRVPVVSHGAERFHGFVRVAALASPAGEFTLHCGFEGPPCRHFAVAALALLPAAPGDGTGRLRPVRCDGLLIDAAPRHASVYGRPADLAGDLAGAAGADTLLRIDRDAERHWIRLRPRLLPVPAFLEAQDAARVEAGCTDPGGNHAWLRGLAGSREQGMRARLAGLGLLEQAAGGRPVLAVVLGLDEPLGARLIHLAAAELERRCTEIILLGREAAAAAQVLIHRGRLPVRVGPDFLAAARHGAQAGCAVVLTEAAALAEALAAERLDALFADALPGERLGALRDLSACTGSGEPADALWRLLRLRAEHAGSTVGVPRYAPATGPASQAAGQEIQAHLRRLWRMLAPVEAA